MTENEALKTLEDLQRLLTNYRHISKDLTEANGIAIKTLEEIQAYRAIGTVERLLQLQHDYWYLNETCKEYSAIGTVEELEVLNRIAEETAEYVKEDKKILETYQRIGTIDEFKALKEKNEPKKPLFSTIHGDSAYHCSSCKKFVGFYDTRIYEYCHNCGQKLDWQ